MTSTLEGLVKSLASSSRFRSPPERMLNRGPGPFRGEEEVLQVADDVAALAVDGEGVVPLPHVLLDGLLQVELFAQLVEVEHLPAGAEPDLSLLRRQFPQEEPEQGGLARAVGADDPHPVAAHDGGREVP